MTDPLSTAPEDFTHGSEVARLHDALLLSVTFDWATADVVAALILVGGARAILSFHSATSAVLPRKMAWGPSSAINEARALSAGCYEIEMQSGDTLCVDASSWSLRIEASPTQP